MSALSYGHFRSRDKDGHTIRSAIAENAMLHANFTVLCVTETALLPWKFSITGTGIGIFDVFCSRDVDF